MDTLSWLANYLPWWVLPVVAAVALVATIPYWTPIWAVMPRWLKTAIVAVSGGFTLYWMGRNKGSKDERDQRAKADAAAVETRSKVHDEISNLKPADRDKRLDRWMRD